MKTQRLISSYDEINDIFCGKIDGKNGYLAKDTINEMKDKIIDIFKDKEQMKEIGECASKTIPISFEVMAKNTYQQYEVIINRYNKK